MPLFLEQPTYGPAGPDGLGWNRLSLNTHFDTRHQCGLLPSTYATLLESRRGVQAWGSYDRCVASPFGSCSSCPIQRWHLERDGISWPLDVPLLLVRIRPLPLSPGLSFADPAAGRSTVHLCSWRGEDLNVKADWRTLRNTAGVLGRAFWDSEGQAFWMARSNPAAASAVVHSKRFRTHTRHALYGGKEGRRLALLSCHGACAHDEDDLRHLAADVADWDPDSGPDGISVPSRLPAVPGIDFGHEQSRTVLRRRASQGYPASTLAVSWALPVRRAAVTALLAYAVRLTGH
ncbi:hypothetical protein [Streptomyces niveus]|uniref:hypothetical protein n=1 Tax=Streptomyces niveus TaxID=193462 RepID=UPI003421B96B